MAKFLLDANLSPRVARFLADTLELDETSLQGQRLGALPDRDVIELARKQGRVIITLDRDHSDYFLDAPRSNVSIIYLDLPSRLRYISSINDLLFEFFTDHAAAIVFDRTLVTIREEEIAIRRP